MASAKANGRLARLHAAAVGADIDLDQHAHLRTVARRRLASGAIAASLSTATITRACRASAARRSSLRAPTTSFDTYTSGTPPSTIASASDTFWQHSPTAPSAICLSPITGDLCVLACGRRRTPAFDTASAMRFRLRSNASRSMTSAGVSISAYGHSGCGRRQLGHVVIVLVSECVSCACHGTSASASALKSASRRSGCSGVCPNGRWRRSMKAVRKPCDLAPMQSNA